MDQVGGGHRLLLVCLRSNLKGRLTARTVGEGRKSDVVSVGGWGGGVGGVAWERVVPCRLAIWLSRRTVSRPKRRAG